MIIAAKKSNHHTLGYLLIAIVLSLLVDLSILPWYFPPTEGWWEIFAWLQNENSRLYKDIYVSHPPLHIIFINLQMKLVGHDFMALRYIGAVTNAVAVALVYIWLSRLTNKVSALLGSLVPSLLTIYPMSAYIVRDYHTTVVLLEAACFACSTYIFRSRNHTLEHIRNSQIIPIFFTGIMCGALVLTKQNIGVFFSLGFAASLLLYYWNLYGGAQRVQIVQLAAIWIAGLLTLPIIITALYGTDWTSVYVNNKSKGSTYYVLTRFLVEPIGRKFIVAVLFGFVLFEQMPRLIKMLRYILDKLSLPLWHLNIPLNKSWMNVLKATVFIVYLQSQKFSYEYQAYILCLTLFLCLGYKKNKCISQPVEAWIKYGWIPLFALAYTSTNTAFYNYVSMQLVLAMGLGYFVFKVSTLFTSRYQGIFSISLAVACCISTVGLKMHGPMYSWWGLRQEGVGDYRQQSSFIELSGFKLDQKTHEFYELLWKERNTLSSDQTIFAYPSIPIAYLLLNKRPQTKYPILWFDVTSAEQAAEIISDLNQNSPDVIYWLKPPKSVYLGHESLRRQPALMSEIDEWIIDAIEKKLYAVDGTMNFPLFRNYWDDSKLAIDHKKINIKILDNSISTQELVDLPGYVSHTNVKASQRVTNGSHWEPNDVIEVVFQNEYFLTQAINKVGMPVASDRYVFYILKKNKPH
jgi:hypothetical protein